MDDPLLVRMCDRIACLYRPTKGLTQGNLPPAAHHGQVGTVDEVHHDEKGAAGSTTEPLGPDDIRMSQPVDHAGLADESTNDSGMLQERSPEEFHGDLTARPSGPRLID